MLDRILDDVRRRLPSVIARAPEIRARAAAAPAPRGFADALARPGLAVIAEVKRRSPSRGPLAPELDPARTARAYAEGGAAAISVLTEPDHFSGSLADLATVGAAVDLPVLRKDFILHEAQIWEARAAGADAVLLIVAALDDPTLTALLRAAEDVGLAALVEVHDETELERALGAGARIVGVNNRDLASFDVDLATAERLGPRIADAGVLAVAESGIWSGEDARRMRDAGYDAVLVGEALVRADDARVLLAELTEAAP